MHKLHKQVLYAPTLCTHPVQLKVEAAGVAHGLALVVATPQCRRRRMTVGAAQALAPIVGHLFVGLDRRPIHAVHLRVQATRVAQVVARSVSTPQRRRHCPAVHTFARLSRVELARA